VRVAREYKTRRGETGSLMGIGGNDYCNNNHYVVRYDFCHLIKGSPWISPTLGFEEDLTKRTLISVREYGPRAPQQ
jgi:hypothetical protein